MTLDELVKLKDMLRERRDSPGPASLSPDECHQATLAVVELIGYRTRVTESPVLCNDIQATRDLYKKLEASEKGRERLLLAASNFSLAAREEKHARVAAETRAAQLIDGLETITEWEDEDGKLTNDAQELRDLARTTLRWVKP